MDQNARRTGDVEDRHVPSFVEELRHTPVQEVFAGSVHTCALTRTGSVYAFGKHEYTGHGSNDLPDNGGANSDVLVYVFVFVFAVVFVSYDASIDWHLPPVFVLRCTNHPPSLNERINE